MTVPREIAEPKNRALRQPAGKGRVGSGVAVWDREQCPEGSTKGKRVYSRMRRDPKRLIPAGRQIW